MYEQIFQPLLTAAWHVLLEASPWLVVGLIAAGLIKAFLPQAWVNRWLGGRGLMPVVRAAVLGTPLPLCSCSVIPAALALRRSGASKGATVSFLISTPENGADSIALSYAMLGPFMTIARPIAAVVSAIAAGGLTLWATRNETDDDAPRLAERRQPPASSCCGTESNPTEPETTRTVSLAINTPADTAASCCSPTDESRDGSEPEPASCCSTAAGPADAKATVREKFLGGMRYAMIDLFGDILPWLAVGVALAIVMMAFVPPGSVAQWASGPIAMVLMVIIGVPMYICATASTPVAAAMLVAGVSPGTVLVFLLAGPATNLGTLGIVRRELGNRSVLAYLAGVGVLVIPLGMLTDWIAVAGGFAVNAQADAMHHVMPHALALIGLVIIATLSVYHTARRIQKWQRRKPADPRDASSGENQTASAT